MARNRPGWALLSPNGRLFVIGIEALDDVRERGDKAAETELVDALLQMWLSLESYEQACVAAVLMMEASSASAAKAEFEAAAVNAPPSHEIN